MLKFILGGYMLWLCIHLYCSLLGEVNDDAFFWWSPQIKRPAYIERCCVHKGYMLLKRLKFWCRSCCFRDKLILRFKFILVKCPFLSMERKGLYMALCTLFLRAQLIFGMSFMLLRRNFLEFLLIRHLTEK